MTSWRVARSLDVLLQEINAAAPNRSKISDGSIGDAAHASRDSDHNPWIVKGGEGIVRARDFTHDPAHGMDGERLFDELCAILAAGSHPAARSGAYVIFNRRIMSFDRRGEGVRPYSIPGGNPHEHHVHLSVTTDPAGFDSTQPWGVLQRKAPDNHVTRGRAYVELGLAELRKAPASRVAVRAMRVAIRAALKAGPRS